MLCAGVPLLEGPLGQPGQLQQHAQCCCPRCVAAQDAVLQVVQDIVDTTNVVARGLQVGSRAGQRLLSVPHVCAVVNNAVNYAQ